MIEFESPNRDSDRLRKHIAGYPMRAAPAFLYLAAALVLGSLPAYGQMNTASIALKPQGYLAAGVRLWTQNGNTIPVCWYTPGYDREKTIIRNSVTATWQTVAALTFVWADVCPTTGSALYVKVQIGRHGSVGTDPHGIPIYDHSTDGQTRGSGMGALSTPADRPASPFVGAGVTLWVEDNGGSEKHRMEYAAVHEFGHVLGFEHEMDRPDPPARACQSTAGPAGLAMGPYDPDSIMNYCNGDGNRHGILSEGDVENIRALYGYPAAVGTFFADLTGDGRADAIAVNHDGTYVMLSDGTKLTNWSKWSMPFYGSRETLFGDVTGGGRADAIAINNQAVYVMSSSGSQFTNWAQWTNVPFFGTRKTLVADVNGDGRADLIAINDEAVYVNLSDGTKFTNCSDIRFCGRGQWTPGAYFGTIGTFVADVNGDGRADLIAVSHDGIHVALSNGFHFVDQGLWFSTRFAGNVATFFADVDGDGRADAIALNYEGIYVSLSTGTSFGAPRLWTNAPFFGEIATMFADVTGDGRADAIAVDFKADFVMKSNASFFDWPAQYFALPGQWTFTPFYGGK